MVSLLLINKKKARVICSLQGTIPMHHATVSFDLKIKSGHCLRIAGANGIGKSSFINYLKTDGRDLLADSSVSFLDQFPIRCFRSLSTRDLIRSLDQSPIKTRNIESYDLAEKFGFSTIIDLPIKGLSGGENQVAKILASLFIDAEIYFLDEPLNFLDEKKLVVLESVLLELLEQGKAIVLVDHSSSILTDRAREVLMRWRGDSTVELHD